MKLVIVESPSKAKTINKYLGGEYQVLASMGHIRDLPSKNGSVQPDQGFSMVWEMDAGSQKNVANIAKEVKNADEVILATDPDREGEAISWHVQEVLKEKGALKNKKVSRVEFHEITKAAVLKAVASPRELDQALVESYLTRRALDYLVGFTLSPVLWRKLPGARSAGRVQSVALRLICDREGEIECFKNQEYWSITADGASPEGKKFKARLTVFEKEKLEKLSITSEPQATHIVKTLEAAHPYTVSRVEKKQVQRHPYAPFTTSTLQQEASRKLGFSAQKTMQLAQKLYEGVSINGETVGLITYMRTDSVSLSQEAVQSIREFILQDFGSPYLPEKPRAYKTKAKNAQEAHEAIRPTSVSIHPSDAKKWVDEAQAKLYELIWKRTLASQMSSAVFDQVSVDMASHDQKHLLRSTGTTEVFNGFLRLYDETKDVGDEKSEEESILPVLQQGDVVALGVFHSEQHFTQPPPRFTEASLVKRLEELGIGRPSTYVSILRVLQERHYVRLERKAFVPEDQGRLVTAFLSAYFPRYVEYSFTADMEEQLDDVSAGNRVWTEVLTEFWGGFKEAVHKTDDVKIGDVIDVLNVQLEQHFFATGEGGEIHRECPLCKEGTLSLKLGRYGAFIGCSDYPKCGYTRPLDGASEESAQDASASSEYPKALGQDSATGLEVSLRKGPYGFYFQRGHDGGDKKELKRAPLSPDISPESATLEDALFLFSLPRQLGAHPETQKPVVAGVGRFGPYIKHEDVFASLKNHSLKTVTLEEALEVLAKKPHKSSGGRKASSPRKTSRSPVQRKKKA